MTTQTHRTISPAILYFGTPILLLTTTNPPHSAHPTNICPMSSAWWLGHRCILGLGAQQHSLQNMLRTRRVVLNLPDDSAPMVAAINRLARTTGSPQPSAWKRDAGYVHVGDKWAHAGLTPQASETATEEGGAAMPPRILECPVQMEAEVVASHPMMAESETLSGAAYAIEVKILKVHVRPDMTLRGFPDRIDPDKVRPVFLVFQEYYGMREGRLGRSRLADVQEEMYRRLTETDSGAGVRHDEEEEDVIEGRTSEDVVVGEDEEMAKLTKVPTVDLARGISNNQ